MAPPTQKPSGTTETPYIQFEKRWKSLSPARIEDGGRLCLQSAGLVLGSTSALTNGIQGLMLTCFRLGSKPKKPSAKANQAAKASLKGVSLRLRESGPRTTTNSVPGARSEGSQDPQVNNLPQTKDPRPFEITQIPPQVYSS